MHSQFFLLQPLDFLNHHRKDSHAMADLHKNVTWGKSSAGGHKKCMGNSKNMLRRSICLLHGKTDRLRALIVEVSPMAVLPYSVWC